MLQNCRPQWVAPHMPLLFQRAARFLSSREGRVEEKGGDGAFSGETWQVPPLPGVKVHIHSDQPHGQLPLSASSRTLRPEINRRKAPDRPRESPGSWFKLLTRAHQNQGV